MSVEERPKPLTDEILGEVLTAVLGDKKKTLGSTFNKWDITLHENVYYQYTGDSSATKSSIDNDFKAISLNKLIPFIKDEVTNVKSTLENLTRDLPSTYASISSVNAKLDRPSDFDTNPYVTKNGLADVEKYVESGVINSENKIELTLHNNDDKVVIDTTKFALDSDVNSLKDTVNGVFKNIQIDSNDRKVIMTKVDGNTVEAALPNIAENVNIPDSFVDAKVSGNNLVFTKSGGSEDKITIALPTNKYISNVEPLVEDGKYEIKYTFNTEETTKTDITTLLQQYATNNPPTDKYVKSGSVDIPGQKIKLQREGDDEISIYLGDLIGRRALLDGGNLSGEDVKSFNDKLGLIPKSAKNVQLINPSTSSGGTTVAIGTSLRYNNGNDQICIGNRARCYGSGATAIGVWYREDNDDSGSNCTASRDCIAVGTGVNLANAYESASYGVFNILRGRGLFTFGGGSISSSQIVEGRDNIVLGVKNRVAATSTIRATSSHNEVTGIYNNEGFPQNMIVIGASNDITNATNSVVMGTSNTLHAGIDGVTVIGSSITPTINGSIIIGKNSATVDTDSDASFGDTDGTSTISASGHDITVPTIIHKHGLVSIGKLGNERRIQNVSDGKISKYSSDAINGAQLNSVITQLLEIIKAQEDRIAALEAK